MPQVTKEDVLDQLRTVNDPELHKDLVTLNMIKNVAICDGLVKVHVELTTPACPLKDTIKNDVTEAVKRLDGVREVELEWSAQVRANQQTQKKLPGVKNVIAVGAGKGGVGKSTIAVLLAIGLQREGASVGLMDADVYGPSIPKMLGIEDGKPYVKGDRILPIVQHDLKVMSMGFMVEKDKAIIWRGPMVHGVIKQFLDQVDWGELDYLIVDLPPGTGDVPLTLSQSIPMTGSVVVCTPQDVALLDAKRAVAMYQQLNVPCIGIIENMSYYLCPQCGHRDEIFDHGGAKRAAEDLKVPFLGSIPLNVRIRINGDAGTPADNFIEKDDLIQQAILDVVRNTAGQVSVKNMLQVSQPTLTIEK
ncbi:MAG: iron-sulfur cluster carrier protein ApbC [Planctomycetes bacterium]|nr:iron-sulfur cluster carrier protein ApbC [Planctomycetota bacterium]